MIFYFKPTFHATPKLSTKVQFAKQFLDNKNARCKKYYFGQQLKCNNSLIKPTISIDKMGFFVQQSMVQNSNQDFFFDRCKNQLCTGRKTGQKK